MIGTDAKYNHYQNSPLGDGGIIVTNLSVKLQGNTLLDGISFSLQLNQHLAIVGASGSGKTTLAKALCGKVFHQGTVEFSGKSTINFVEQHYHFKTRSNTQDFYYQQRYNSFDNNDAFFWINFSVVPNNCSPSVLASTSALVAMSSFA